MRAESDLLKSLQGRFFCFTHWPYLSLMSAPGKTVIASYNFRKAIGRDGRRNPLRIMDVIASLDADVVVLQEANLRFGGRRPISETDELHSNTNLRAVDVAPNVKGHRW